MPHPAGTKAEFKASFFPTPDWQRSRDDPTHGQQDKQHALLYSFHHLTPATGLMMGIMPLFRFLMPDFTWPNPIPHTVTDQIPETPRATNPHLRRLWGFLHHYLRFFSHHYCGWVGIKYDNQIAQLPFGLILKWSDGTRLEEVLTMQAARRAGLPVPKVICYGDHPESPHAPMSILMTRIPGDELGQAWERLSDTDRTSIQVQLKYYLETIRKWKNPWGGNRICSLLGTTVRSVRIPRHVAGPFESEQDLNDYLIGPAWPNGKSEAKYKELLEHAKKMHAMPHEIVFTHGDLKHHNIMVQNGKSPDFWTGSQRAGIPITGTLLQQSGILRRISGGMILC